MKIWPILVMFCVLQSYAQAPSVEAPEDLPALRIVGLVAKGSVLMNELNIKSDWIRLENFGQDTIHFSDHKIFISDDVNKLKKFRLRKKSLAPDSSMVIWCDDMGITREQIHTNFKLSSMGETVTLTIVMDNRRKTLDQVYYRELGPEAQQTLYRSESDLMVYRSAR